MTAKLARIEALQQHREKLSGVERAFAKASTVMRNLNRNLFAKPKETLEEMGGLVDQMIDAFLEGPEATLHIMGEKAGGEDVYYHSLNVTILAMMLAKELKAPGAAVRMIGLGALLHDIGKVEIPDRIARKGAPLTQAEFNLFQQHCPKGVEMARTMGVAPEALTIIEQHHEHVDGSGYPKKLQGPQLSLLSKLVALANTYDNLCNPPDASKSLTPHEALSIMYGQRRAQFDATAMATFIRSVGIYPPGTLVVLSNGTLGMVVSVNSSRPLKPTVLVYDPAVPKELAMVVDLEEEPEVTVTRTMRPQQLPQAAYDYLAPRKRMTYYFHNDPAKPGA
jgi:putative nucleotidyltransferase with HDIG domain